MTSTENEYFGHRDHLRAAWLYLKRYPFRLAAARMERTIRRLAAHHGQPSKYHHTLTMLWMRLVAAHAAAHAEETFDRFIATQDTLLDKSLVLRFYSRELLFSRQAREQWVEPDLRTLPVIR